jgi:hypothetical protein
MPSRPDPSRPGPSRPDPAPPTLAETQALLARLVTLPGRVAEARAAFGIQPGEVVAIFAPTKTLPAEQCLNIYAEMYFYRLATVIRSQHERLEIALGGAELFEVMVRAYLRAFAPTSHDIGDAGARLPGFLSTWEGTRDRPWLAELARFERSLLDVYVARDAEATTMAELAALSPEGLASTTLYLVPAHELAMVRFAVDTWAQSLDSATVSVAEVPAPCFRTVLVWRQDATVLHRPIDDDDEWACLIRLARGAPLAELGEVLAERHGESAAPARLHQLLGHWIGAGLVTLAAPM